VTLLSPHLPLPPLEIVRGYGVWLEGSDGARYFDASSGSVCVNVGHAQPHVVSAIANQASRIAFGHPGVRRPRELEALTDHLLARIATLQHALLFSTTGTAAVELAIALARQYQRSSGYRRRHRIVTADLGYHGSSALTLGLSGHRRRRPTVEESFGLSPSFHAPYGRSAGLDHSCDQTCADEVAAVIDSEEDVAAVLIEPVNGTTGGGFSPPSGYLTQLRSICRSRGVLLIHDEVLTGLGRCGSPLASDACAEASPDLTVLSKGLGAGYAVISAVLISPEVIPAIENSGEPLPMMGTMAGAPLAAATALAVQEVLDEIGAFAAASRGSALFEALRSRLAPFEIVRDVRGRGFFYGVELAPATAPVLLQAARAESIQLYPFNGFLPDGSGEGIIVAPPLTAVDDELGWLLDRLEAAFSVVRPPR